MKIRPNGEIVNAVTSPWKRLELVVLEMGSQWHSQLKPYTEW